MSGAEQPAGPRAPRICAPVLGLSRETIYGGGAFDRANLKALAAAGCDVLIVLAINLRCELEPGWRVVRVPITRQFKLGALLTNALFFCALCWLWFVRGERWDWLRMGDPYYVGPAVRLVAALTRTPIMAHVHHVDPMPAWRRGLCRWSLAAAQRVWTPSAFSLEQAVEFYGLDRARAFWAHNAVPELALPEGDREQQLHLLELDGRELVLFIGAMIERKNLPLLLRAFAAVAARRPQAVLAIAGDAPRSTVLKAALVRQADELGLSERVRILGRIDAQTKGRLLKACSVFVLPSKIEGFGLAAAEALQAGAAVVAGNVGGLPEVVRHAETGLLIDPEDEQGLATAIIGLLEDEPRRLALGLAGQRDVQERFSWERQAATILEQMRAAQAARSRVLGVILNSGESLARLEQEGQRGRFENLYLARYRRLADEVLIFSYGREDHTPYNNVRVVPGLRTYGLVYGALLPLVRLREVRRCDLLRVMQIGGALPAVGSRLLWGVPYVATYGYRYVLFAKVKGRPLYSLIVRAIEWLGLRCASRVIVTTAALQQHVLRSKPERCVTLLPNGADLTSFVAKSDYALNGTARVLYVGRLVPQKDLGLLVEALALLEDRAELLIAGDGPERAAILEQAERRGVRLSMLGMIPHAELPRIYRDADVFCLPSKIEGHPKTLIEAMACGLPCAATDVLGTRDVIEHNVDGLLARRDPADLAQRLSGLIQDRGLAERLGRAARAKAESQYDLNKILDREEALLRRMFEERRG